MEKKSEGRVLSCVGGRYTVARADDPSDTVVCPARGVLRHRDASPLPGDLVSLSTEGKNGETAVSEILERKNSLIRPPLANLDFLFCTVAAASPAPSTDTLDKLLSIAEYHGIEPVLIVTKTDLDADAAGALAADYRRVGYTVFSVNTPAGEGVEEIRDWIGRNTAGKICAVAGASGVGKSTLMNALFPFLTLETGDVSVHNERGKNTTRRTELYPMPHGGYFADTPGFTLLDFEHFDFFPLVSLADTMRDFASYSGKCRYSDCTHTGEEGCAIALAVEEGKIPAFRLTHYRELYAILKTKKKW